MNCWGLGRLFSRRMLACKDGGGLFGGGAAAWETEVRGSPQTQGQSELSSKSK